VESGSKNHFCLNKKLNIMEQHDYNKIVNVFNSHQKDIKNALHKGSNYPHWKLRVLPKYDNIIGGYNIQATAVDVVDHDTVLDTFEVVGAIHDVKSLPFVSKAAVSPAYNKKMTTVIAIGLKIK
jgi:hypothetical protein